MYLWIGLGLDKNSEKEIRDYSLEINKQYGVNEVAFLLPQHISLKMSFETEIRQEITEEIKLIFENTECFDVKAEKLGTIPGIIWLEIEETTAMRKMHNDILALLKEKYNIDGVSFDGDNFKFHSTVFFDMENKEKLSRLFDAMDKKLFENRTFRADRVYFGVSESGAAGTYSLIDEMNLL